MKRSLSLILLTSLTLLGGCNLAQDAYNKYIKPSTATLNGYTAERDASGAPTGKVDLNISALDAKDEPIDGKISNPVATAKVKLPTGSVRATQTYAATAEIKFDIRVEEIVNAVLDIDQSGSMKQTDPARKRVDAAESFIERIKGEDRLAVMTFQGDDEGYRALEPPARLYGRPSGPEDRCPKSWTKKRDAHLGFGFGHARPARWR